MSLVLASFWGNSWSEVIVYTSIITGVWLSLIVLISQLKPFYDWTMSWTYHDKGAFLTSLRERGEWAVITGCTDGIGLEMARVIDKSGFKLILIGRNMTKLEPLLVEFHGSIAIQCDLSRKVDTSSISSLLIGKRVALLINNAGVCHGNSLFSDLSENTIEQSIQVNVTSTVLIAKTVLPFLVKSSIIMNISSGSSLAPCPYLSIYSATKAFLNQWAHSLQVELNDQDKRDIIVQNYTPYYIATRLSGQSPTLTVPDASEWAESALSRLGQGDTTGYIFHDMMRWVLTSFMSRSAAETYMASVNRPT